MKSKHFILASIALTTLVTASAFADISDYGKPGPFSDGCVNKIIDAIQAADKDTGYIGEGATLSDLDDVSGGQVKDVRATVNEADYTRGYSVWNLKVKGTSDSCKVLSVTLSDVAT